MTESDTLQCFIFENRSVRGEVVRLNESFRTIMQQHAYPPVIQRILGEMLLSASLLGASIKFQGRITVQFQGKGRVRLLIAESSDQLELRGFADWQTDLSSDELIADLKRGTLAIMMDPLREGGQRYQGIVEWQGDSLSESLENYFNRSEQLPTHIRLAVSDSEAAGFLLQTMPRESSRSGQLQDHQHDWEHLSHLTATLTSTELLTVNNATLLHRLYHEDDVRLLPARPVVFRCKCSVTRSENTLRLLTEKEIEEELRDKQSIVVTCEFCNKEYVFDRVDIARIFKQGHSDPSGGIH